MTGLFTRTRGNDFGNVIGRIAGFVVVAYMSGLGKAVMGLFGAQGLSRIWRSSDHEKRRPQ